MNMFGFTFCDILRDHSLELLDQREPERLREYQILLTCRIEEKQTALNRAFLMANERAEIGADIRWYQQINEQIADLLTVEYHQKAA